MTRGKRASDPADRKSSLSVTIFPWTTHSVVTVDLTHWDSVGRHVDRLAYWHLDLKRSDVSGKSTDDVLRLICKRVLRRLESGPDSADSVAVRTDSELAVGPGAPLGATGGTVTQDCLPGSWPTPGTPGGIDSV